MQNELRNISRRDLRSPKIRMTVAISIVYLASLKQNGNETLSFVFRWIVSRSALPLSQFLVFTHVTFALTTVAIRHVGAKTNALNRDHG